MCPTLVEAAPQAARLTLAQRRPAAELLTNALLDDPMMRFIVSEDARRARFVSWLFSRVVHYSMLYGEVHTTSELEGVACWLPPGRASLALHRLVRTGLLGVVLRLRPAALRRFWANLSYVGQTHQRLMTANHWYLWTLGVDPACQGRGIGGRLLRPVLERAKAGRLACYLETHNERNLAFYGKHGFRVASDGVIPRWGLRVWGLIR